MMKILLHFFTPNDTWTSNGETLLNNLMYALASDAYFIPLFKKKERKKKEEKSLSSSKL